MTRALTIGVPFFLQLTASGGTKPYTYSIISGLPAGLSLNASTGVISGTPTTAQSSTAIAWQVEDALAATATDSFNVVVQAVPVAVPHYRFIVELAGLFRLRGALAVRVLQSADLIGGAVAGGVLSANGPLVRANLIGGAVAGGVLTTREFTGASLAGGAVGGGVLATRNIDRANLAGGAVAGGVLGVAQTLIPSGEEGFFILAGQSNAEGHTANPGFSYTFLRSTIYVKDTGHTTDTDDGDFDALVFGTNNSLDAADDEADVGAEFAKLFEASDPASLRMVKVAVGSTGFDGGTGDWARGGVLRESLINRYLRRAIPDAVTAGDQVNILPVLWIQGENEATNSTWAAAYNADLTEFIADVRGATGIPTLPFVIVRLHDDLTAGPHPHAATVRSAQDAVAAADANVYILNPSSITGFDGVHYTVAGFEDLAQEYYNLAATIGATPYGLNTDANAFVARLSGSYSDREEHAINSLVATLDLRTIAEGGSQWDNLTAFTINALANATDATLNLKDTSYTQTWVGSPTFTARQGVKLSGSGQYLRSGVTPASISSSANGLYGCYLRLEQNDDKYIATAFDGTNATVLQNDFNANNRTFALINRTSGLIILNGSDERGANSVFRSGTTGSFLREQGTAATATMTGATAVNAEMWWGAFHTNGTLDPGFETSNEFAAEWQSIGVVWTESEVRLLHAEIQQVLSVFGSAV